MCKDSIDNSIHYTALVPVTGITLNPNQVTIQIESQTQVTATVIPSNASNKDVTWLSSNNSVLSISGNGSTVTLIGVSEGYATVTCTSSADPTKTQTCSVEVTKIPVSEVTVTPSTATVNVGSTTTLDADVEPIEATYRELTWTSDNTNIATVDYSYSSRCVVTGVSAGTVTITATSMDDSTKYDTATVTVQNVAPPSNPVNEGYYTDIPNPIDSGDWYPEEFEEFPIAINQENTEFIPYDGEAMIQIWVKKGTTLANGLMSIYNDYEINPIGNRGGWGNPLFANYGLKCEGDCYFYNFHEVYDYGDEISFDIELGADEPEEPAKIYYEDQSGNKWYLFEWDGNY